MTVKYYESLEGLVKEIDKIVLGCIRVRICSEQRNTHLYKHFCTISIFSIVIFSTFWRTGITDNGEVDDFDFHVTESIFVSDGDSYNEIELRKPHSLVVLQCQVKRLKLKLLNFLNKRFTNEN